MSSIPVSDGNVQRPTSIVGSFEGGASGCTFCVEYHSVYCCTKYETNDENEYLGCLSRGCTSNLRKPGYRSADSIEKHLNVSTAKLTGTIVHSDSKEVRSIK